MTSTDGRPRRPHVAVVLAIGLLIVAAFQTALTFGAPYGAAALGGSDSGQLSDALRVVTGVSAMIWLFATTVVLARGGRAVIGLPESVSRVGTAVLAGVLGLGALLNFASQSSWERFGWGPFTAVLVILCVILARSAVGRPEPLGG